MKVSEVMFIVARRDPRPFVAALQYLSVTSKAWSGGEGKGEVVPALRVSQRR